MNENTRFTIEEPTWNGAEVYRWNGNQGELVAYLSITSAMSDDMPKFSARLESGYQVPGTFTKPEAAIEAIRRHLERMA